MNGRTIRYGAVGLGILALLIVLGWFALRETPPAETPVKIMNMPARVHVISRTVPAEDTPPESVASSTVDATPTNAAVFYRQAFALYETLSTEQKTFITYPKTNIDSSAEAELCERIRPICDLMHQATEFTNCDWELEMPLTFSTRLPHLAECRSLARSAVWSVTHCRKGDTAGAISDLQATVRLGQNATPTLIGHLVDMALQGMAIESVAEQAGTLVTAGDARLAQIFDSNHCIDSLRRALEQEADMVTREADRLATLPTAEAERQVKLALEDKAQLQSMNASQALTSWRQVADLYRQYSTAIQLSNSEYQAWLASLEAVRMSNPFAENFLSAADSAMAKTQRVAINTAMVEAGLAVMKFGPDVLQSHLDPATGKPFVYTQTDDGFELQSGYQFNGQSLRLKFK